MNNTRTLSKEQLIEVLELIAPSNNAYLLPEEIYARKAMSKHRFGSHKNYANPNGEKYENQ